MCRGQEGCPKRNSRLPGRENILRMRGGGRDELLPEHTGYGRMWPSWGLKGRRQGTLGDSTFSSCDWFLD